MNFLATMQRLGVAEPIQIERLVSDGYDDNGRRLAGGPVVETVIGTVQPASGRDLRRLPEGLREAGAITLYAPAEIRLNDTVTHAGRRYSVGHVEAWPRGGYWRAIATEEA